MNHGNEGKATNKKLLTDVALTIKIAGPSGYDWIFNRNWNSIKLKFYR